MSIYMHTARQTPRHFVAPFSLSLSPSLSLSLPPSLPRSLSLSLSLLCVAVRFVCLRVCMLRHMLERKLDKSTIEHLNFQWGPTLPVTRRSDPLNPRSPVTNDSRRRMGGEVVSTASGLRELWAQGVIQTSTRVLFCLQAQLALNSQSI